MATRKGTAASTRRVERAAGRLATTAVNRMRDELPWFGDLAPDHRSWVGLVAQSGIAAFVRWLRAPAGELAGPVFGVAPRALTRVVTLQQTVELVQLVVEVVESAVPELAAPGEEAALREGVLRFSREVAFAAAHVYASAAEERGAWHARSRALLVEAVVHGDADAVLDARASALGWTPPPRLAVVVGTAPDGEPEQTLDDVESRCRAEHTDAVAGLHGERLVVLLGVPSDRDLPPPGLVDVFAGGPVVVGPCVDSLGAAGDSAREALAALAVVRAWPSAPVPVRAADLLPERALAGDEDARSHLADLHDAVLADPAVADTLTRYLEVGRSVEATARATFLHANTVRYRLRKAAQLTGLDPLDPRAAYVLQVALSLGRLAARQ